MVKNTASSLHTKLSDDQFKEMKERINRLLMDNQELVQMNVELRSMVTKLKAEKVQLASLARAASEGKTLVPVPALGLDAMKALVEWHDKPNQAPLSEIVEKTRSALAAIELVNLSL